MLLFAAGAMFGGIIGVFGVALFVAARRGDDMAAADWRALCAQREGIK